MPWKVIKQDGKHCVAKEDEDAPIKGGCHDNEEDAARHIAALEANTDEAKADVIALQQIAAVKAAVKASNLAPPMLVCAKAITDAPNLRERFSRACAACAQFKPVEANPDPGAPTIAMPCGMCEQYQFETHADWVCDSFEVKPPAINAEQIASAVEQIAEAVSEKTEPNYAEVKFVGDEQDEVEGYSVIWGTPDLHDQSKTRDYFTPETDFWDDKLPLPRPITHHHGFDPITKGDPVVAMKTWEQPDRIGLHYRARLRSEDGYADYVKTIPERKELKRLDLESRGEGSDSIDWDAWEKKEFENARRYDAYVKNLMRHTRGLIASGAFKTSSDSIPQYVQRVSQSNGSNFVKVWPHVSDAWTTCPAEPRMRQIAELKAEYKAIGVDLQLPETPSEAQSREDVAAKSAGQPAIKTKPQGGNDMDEKEILALLEKREQEKEAKAKSDAEAKAALDAEVEKRVQAQLAQLAKDNRRLPFAAKGDNVRVYSKYDGMRVDDLAFLAMLRGEAKAIGRSTGPDEELLRALAVKSFKAIEDGKLEAKAMEDAEFKSNEVMQSTLASYGDEWVFSNVSTQLWMKVRDESRLLKLIPEQEIPKGYESDTIPLEGTEFTFYNVSQVASDDSTMKTPVATVTSSKMGTGQRVVTVGKLGARGEISGELDEDSIIDSIPEARRKLEAQLPEELEFVLFNADDTAATDNINGNGTPTSGADYTVFKGLIRLGLKTNTDNAYDMGAAIDTTKIAALYALLGTDGLYVYNDPTKAFVFCDGNSWLTKIQTLSDKLTVANAGQGATINDGGKPDIGIPILGVRWYPSGGVKRAQATGIRHGTESNNVYGRAVLLRPDQWKLRWKRRAKFETNRIARADVTEIIVTVRLGIGYYDTDASAVAYDI